MWLYIVIETLYHHYVLRATRHYCRSSITITRNTTLMLGRKVLWLSPVTVVLESDSVVLNTLMNGDAKVGNDKVQLYCIVENEDNLGYTRRDDV